MRLELVGSIAITVGNQDLITDEQRRAPAARFLEPPVLAKALDAGKDNVTGVRGSTCNSQAGGKLKINAPGDEGPLCHGDPPALDRHGKRFGGGILQQKNLVFHWCAPGFHWRDFATTTGVSRRLGPRGRVKGRRALPQRSEH